MIQLCGENEACIFDAFVVDVELGTATLEAAEDLEPAGRGSSILRSFVPSVPPVEFVYTIPGSMCKGNRIEFVASVSRDAIKDKLFDNSLTTAVGGSSNSIESFRNFCKELSLISKTISARTHF